MVTVWDGGVGCGCWCRMMLGLICLVVDYSGMMAVGWLCEMGCCSFCGFLVDMYMFVGLRCWLFVLLR